MYLGSASTEMNGIASFLFSESKTKETYHEDGELCT